MRLLMHHARWNSMSFILLGLIKLKKNEGAQERNTEEAHSVECIKLTSGWMPHFPFSNEIQCHTLHQQVRSWSSWNSNLNQCIMYSVLLVQWFNWVIYQDEIEMTPLPEDALELCQYAGPNIYVGLAISSNF